jgi:hypothetical protein
MRKISVGIALLAIGGCATAPPPIVDLAGKDPVAVNRDMAECSTKGLGDMPFFAANGERAHYYSRCLEERGYTILGPRVM